MHHHLIHPVLLTRRARRVNQRPVDAESSYTVRFDCHSVVYGGGREQETEISFLGITMSL